MRNHSFLPRYAVILLLFALTSSNVAWSQPKLKIHDKRIRVQVFAEAPDIVTPTGIAVNRRGDVFVVECHTHFPPQDYIGPSRDRIKLLRDTDGNGVADRITIFAHGTKHTMNIAVHPADDSVYIATRAEIIRLEDKNGDGRADTQERIAFLKTAGSYPHNGLSGFAFGMDGRMYFGLGENLGASYELIAKDRRFKGGGEGGNIFSCRPDGGDLRREATGFWNPFHVCFDGFGNLFTVDNDPDARPPCRLIHVVPGGDYGYRFRNGRRGIHPFTAWDGELPGTLPMASGTGEAPSGVAVYDSDMFPQEYRGRLLVTSWGEHRLETYVMKPHGATLRGEMSPMLSGGENFRPVGVVVAPDGSIYLSDWVDRSYKLHSKGRIWKVTAKSAAARFEGQGALSQNGAVRRAAIRSARQKKQLADLNVAAIQGVDSLVRSTNVANLQSDPFNTLVAIAGSDKDPRVRAVAIQFGRPDANDLRKFVAPDQPGLVRAAALRRMKHRRFLKELYAAAGDKDPFIRQAAQQSMLATGVDAWRLYQTGTLLQKQSATLILRKRKKTLHVGPLLVSPSAIIRQMAVQWVGEEKLSQYRPAIDEILASASSRSLFESCLATLELLDNKKRKSSSDEWDGRQYAFDLLGRDKLNERVQTQILRTLGGDYPRLSLVKLTTMLARARMPSLQMEIVKSIRESGSAKKRNPILLQLASRRLFSIRIRAESLVGFEPRDSAEVIQLGKLVKSADGPVGLEALRALRGAKRKDFGEEELQLVKSLATGPNKIRRALAKRILRPEQKTKLPAKVKDALQMVRQFRGDPRVGERLFFNRRLARCATCHESKGRGGRIGPELSQIGRSMSAERLLESVLHPSREIAPRYVPWTVVRTDGRTFSGLYLGHDNKDRHAYADGSGKVTQIPIREIARRIPLNKSIMPDGLAAELTLQELSDLLAYLQESK